MDGGPSDLMDSIDQLANAEPLDAEDDLVLRMQASKVQGGGGPSFRGVGARDRKAKQQRDAFAPSKSIAKRRQPRVKLDGMKVDSEGGARPSALAIKAAAALASGIKVPPVKLKRSYSI